jgi:tetratricopeptide (TPR) repeat protein
LADVLRAYGRTRDVDAVRVILSFCNSDRVQLRDASREAVAAIGEPAMWQLKDVYLGLTGQKAPKEWAWDRLARELFALHDRARLAEVYKLMDDGVAAAADGKLTDATSAFDKVLARSPLFDRRKEMVPTYVARAKELESDHRDDALAMLRKAVRLDPKAAGNRQIEAEIDYLEGAISIERGAPDKFILGRALELDPTNDRARQALASLDEQATVRKTSVKRYVAAMGVGILALLGMLFLARRRKDPTEHASAPPT